MKKCGLYEDHIRLPRGGVRNDDDGEMPVQERPCLLWPSTAVVVSVAVVFVVRIIGRAGIAIAAILPGGAGFVIISLSPSQAVLESLSNLHSERMAIAVLATRVPRTSLPALLSTLSNLAFGSTWPRATRRSSFGLPKSSSSLT